ncbi:MAG: GNAT family N-acetyltransferase [Ancalomicrobiaceae bacterium]|nr:GNAT family N-acetyltransferase [Ancalomicrobiaceae bacterium]
MMFVPVSPFIAAEYQVKFATCAWERDGAAALRRQVFCREQGLFQDDDRDGLDDAAIPIVAISMLGVVGDAVVGTVRIHEAEPGVWWGSRLAVAPEFRKVGSLGAALIRLAVASAHARGCTRFLAHVQSQNALLFRRLHWQTLDVVDLFGRQHHRMAADLAHYPPFPTPEAGFRALRKAA